MKIAVTGASGFIGRHVVSSLIKNGYEVVAVVRQKENFANFNIDCRIIEHDIGQEDNDAYNKLGQPDVLIHLAWGALTNLRSLQHIDFELPVHYRFIRLMIESGLKHVTIAGTCLEYGMQSGMLSEELETKPSIPYGYAKDALRKQLQFFQCEYSFNLTWLRPFYIYGEDQPDNTLYSQLRLAVQREDVVFNMSGGEQLRDYLHIDKVAKRIIELSVTKKNIGIVNICSGVPVSVRCLVEQWIQKNKWDIELNLGYYPYPDYEPLAFWGDSNKFNQIIKSGV